jgi:dolichol-phosphate mannosyltransferase
LTRWAESHPASLERHPRNLGPGAAFISGFRRVLTIARDTDPIVTLEADRTSDLQILPEMLRRFDTGAQVVLASVYHPGGGLENAPFHRRALSSGANYLLRHLFEMPNVRTFSSFYRIYQAGLLRKAMQLYGLRLIEEPGFASVVELLLRLHRMGARIEEVPMVLDSSRRIGSSRMRLGRTVTAYLRMMARQRLEPPQLDALFQT